LRLIKLPPTYEVELVQNAFNDYLHSNQLYIFLITDISVEGNELLLGKIYYAFGLDSFNIAQSIFNCG
jgi:hypothetical protein